MFNFDGDEDGSEVRFRDDVNATKRTGKVMPWVRHRGWWIAHNLVAHPIIAVLPHPLAFEFHDYTSRRLHDIR